MKKGLWKSSLVTMTMLTSLTAPVLVSAGSMVMADSNQPQSVYVANGDSGLSASVGKHYTDSSRPALDRAYRALGDPSKVGASINQQTDLKQMKQTARQSLQVYGQKASDYLGDQNLSDHAKTELQTQLKQVLTVANANLDQAKTLNQLAVALHTGAYGVLATASATTVSQAKTDTNAAQVAEKNVGDNSSAMATGDDNKVADLMKSTDADREIDVDTTKNDNDQQLVNQYQQFLTQMSQKLDQYLKANGQNTSGDKKSANKQSNSSSNSSQSGQNNGNNNAGSQSGTDTSNANNANGEQPGKGKNFTSVQAMIQYLNSQHGKDKLNSVKGATVETTIKMTHKAEGDYKTIFADNDGTLFLSKTGYNNIKPGQKVKVTIDAVAEGSANSPLGESVGWYDYTVTFSDLSIVNDAGKTNKQAINGNGQGQNGSNNAGQATPSQADNTNGNQAGTSGNAPTGSAIPQTGQSKLNAWLSAVGISLMGLLGIGASRKIKKDQN